MYTYKALLIRVVDADTVRLELDVGFHMRRQDQPYRLLRIDAPELSTQAGKDAKAALEQHLLGKMLVATTYKSDSFGRYLAELFADGENVSDWLVLAGFATYRTY